MAAVSVSAQNTRLDDAESTTDWIGIAKSPLLESDFRFQSSNCISFDKGVSGVAGVALTDNVTSDISGAGTYNTVIFKITTYAPGLMNTFANGGLRTYIGSGANETTDNYVYYHHGNDTYPLTRSWLVVAIDPNVAAYRVTTNGTPSLTAADFYGSAVNNTTSSKIGSIGVDAVDLGGGLTLVGGDGASTDGVWQDFIDHDEGTAANRYGYIFTLGAIIVATGAIVIGTATATEFTDANKTIAFQDGLFAEGFSSLSLGLNSASTVISMTDTTVIGEGAGPIIQDFHTTNDVDGTNEEVDIVGHGYKTGDYLDYSKQGGTAAMGLTDGTDYWVNAVTVDSISFHTTLANALAGTSAVNLTASGTETHRLTKLTDTRPDFIVSNNSGSATLDGNVYLNHRNVTFTTGASQTGGRIECELLTQASADIDNLTIVTSAAPSVACLQDPTFGTTTDLHDVDFVQGALGVNGHALEIDTATSYTLTNITFTGYGATTSDQAAIDVTAVSGTVTLNISGGDSPTYKTAGATVDIVLNPVTLSVNVKDNTGANLQNARVYMKASDGTGPLPYQDTVTITRAGTVATVAHTAHGMATNDKVKIVGITDKTEDNNGTHTITVTGANAYTYVTTDSGSTSYTGTITSTWVALDGLTDVNGDISISKSYSSNQPVDGWARKSTASPLFAQFPMAGTINTATGLTISVQLSLDE